MAEFPILPLKTDALLGDTMHLTTEEFGAYMRLLVVMWRQKGRLVYDEQELRRIAGCHQVRWSHIRKAVLKLFTIADGQISQKRLTTTWLDAQEVRAQRRIAGAKGNASRWGRRRFTIINNPSIDHSNNPDKPL